LNSASQLPQIKELLPLLKKWLPENLVIIKDREKAKVINREKLCGT